MPQSRRSFLATLGAAAIGAALRPAHLAARTRHLDDIGLQLYTVRSAMRTDFDATLARVAEIGYRKVEFAGWFERKPAQIAAVLRANGLTAPSAHIDFNLLGDDFPRTLDTAAAIGHTYVTVPWIPQQNRDTVDDWKRTAALFNEHAAAARAAGLRFAYHNHDFEFTRVNGVVPFDVLLSETEPGLVDFELDIYWITRAGFDAVDYMARHAGRFTMTHLKDSAGAPAHTMVDVGSGTIDFAAVLKASSRAGVQHHFVEHDQPADPIASIRASHAYLAALNS